MKMHAATIAMVGLMAGCSVTVTPEPAPVTPGAPGTPGVTAPAGEGAAASRAESDARIAASLATLQKLSIFQVLGAVEHVPESANCYSLPCPGHEAEFDAARAADADHVAAFTEKVVSAAKQPPAADPTTVAAAERNLEKLRMLGVVEVGDLIVAAPLNNGNCYGLPCPGEKAAADAENRERAGRLANIAGAF
jgi:hypothetical protein